MAVDTLRMVLSKSVVSVEDLREARKQVWYKFEAERSKENPHEFLVIMDGKAYPLSTEEEFDEFNRQFTAYWIVRSAMSKVITLTLFA